jgi:threonine dehydratase
VPPVDLHEIQHAHNRLADVSVRTPVLAYGGDVPAGNKLWLKAECLQRTGSFKFRGAYNAISSLSAEERERGVITYSSGNHGQAVACAASMLGVRSVVVMPEDAIPVKVALTRRWGAAVEFAGHSSLDRQARALELVEEHGYTVIPPFDDRRIIAGQGTTGLEILEQKPNVEAVVVPVGGGGLISGISTAIKALRPDVRVIGVEPDGGADAKASFETGTLVTLGHVETVADGLRTSRIGDLNFATIRECVDEIVTVSDEQALQAVGLLANEARLVVEPSGAVTTAAVLFGRTGLTATAVLAVISGGNIDPARLRTCLAEPALAGS